MATSAKAKFSAMLDAAESEGPQVIQRRQKLFVVTTEEEIEKRIGEAIKGKREHFLSAWDAMKPSFRGRYDVEFPRVRSRSRVVSFE